MTLVQLIKAARNTLGRGNRWLLGMLGLLLVVSLGLVANGNLNLDIELDGIGDLNPYIAVCISFLLLYIVLYSVIFLITLMVHAVRNAIR